MFLWLRSSGTSCVFNEPNIPTALDGRASKHNELSYDPPVNETALVGWQMQRKSKHSVLQNGVMKIRDPKSVRKRLRSAKRIFYEMKTDYDHSE